MVKGKETVTRAVSCCLVAKRITRKSELATWVLLYFHLIWLMFRRARIPIKIFYAREKDGKNKKQKNALCKNHTRNRHGERRTKLCLLVSRWDSPKCHITDNIKMYVGKTQFVWAGDGNNRLKCQMYLSKQSYFAFCSTIVSTLGWSRHGECSTRTLCKDMCAKNDRQMTVYNELHALELQGRSRNSCCTETSKVYMRITLYCCDTCFNFEPESNGPCPI